MRDRQQYFAFGPFVLDTARHLLLRDGEPVPLTPKGFDTLLVLVEHGGNLLSKDDLMNILWPDRSVEEANLTQQISTIRKALADGASGQYIVTVPGRGYRFAAPVREWSGESAPAPELPARPVATRKWLKLTPVLAALVIAMALFAIGFRQRAPKTLAVLPFQNLTQDPNMGFLGFSLADAIITKLDFVNSLSVRPSYAIEKYRNATLDIRAAARDLRVDTLLIGSFIREGEDLRITVQLIDAEAQNILWKDTLDLKFDRLLMVQDEVAAHVIGGLALKLSPEEGERLRRDDPVKPEAYEYYLRGVDRYARSDSATAIRMLERSAEIDPGYALTWAQLGRAYTANASFQLGGRDEYRKAQSAYEKALSLHPSQIEPRIYMANFFTDTGQVLRAVPILRDALRSNPNHAEARWELGYAYRFGGMLRESVQESEKARRLDPTVKLSTSAPNAFLYLGEYDAFLERIPPGDDSAFLLFYRGFAQYYKRDPAAAAVAFDRAFERDPALLQAILGKAIAYGIRHQAPTGRDMLQQMEQKIEERGVGDPEALYKLAQAYAVLGDNPSALRVLRRSIENGFYPYPYLAADPLLDNLRKDPGLVPVLTLARERHEAFRRTLF